jgi:hypothetical protein
MSSKLAPPDVERPRAEPRHSRLRQLAQRVAFAAACLFALRTVVHTCHAPQPPSTDPEDLFL